MQINSEGSLVMTNDDSQVFVNGNATITKESGQLNSIYDYTYWSSPVKNETIEQVFSNANLNNVYYWDQSVQSNYDGGDVTYMNILLWENGYMHQAI